MSDLFISYSTLDRPWADRLYVALKTVYPSLDLFLDHLSIPAGADWRSVLVEKARTTQNLVVLWSDNAKTSNEVGPEIQSFDQARQITPLVNGTRRTLFYVPLAGEYGPMQAGQSFVEFKNRGVYDAAATDRGASKLDTDPLRSLLNQCARWIGSGIARYNPVKLAVLAMNTEIVDLLDPFFKISTLPGYPSLESVLTSLGMTLPNLKTRYGPTAFDWRPFGTAQTVIELMEDARRAMNPDLREFRFEWEEVDLFREIRNAPAAEPVIQSLNGSPSVLVIDPISLHNLLIKPIFDKLGDYFSRREAVVITLAPNQSPWLESLLLSISEKGGNILNPYFNPLVPATGTFAGCGLNLGHKMELTRMIRCGLGLHHMNRKRQDEGELVKMG